MNRIINISLLIIVIAFSSCSKGQGNKVSLDPKEFKAKIESTKDAIILDVRTPEEYSGGHLQNATNIDWNLESAEATLKALDPSKTYFVYCLSGGRSSSAASFLRTNGFKEVYELSGGMMKWRSESLPIETNVNTNNVESAGMSLSAFEKLIINDKVVVVDIYAEWCAPCKRMAPYLTEMQKTMSDKIEIIRIDADKNVELCKALQVDALPTIYVYKKGLKTFSHIGYLSQEELTKQL